MHGLIILFLFVVAWQLLFWITGDVALAPPASAFQYMIEMLLDPRFWPHGLETLSALGKACAITWTLGLVVGVLLGVSKLASETAEPLFAAIYALPKIVLYPVVLLFFGLGMPAKVAFGVINSIIPMILLTMNGVRNLNPVYLRAARAVQLTAPQTLWQVLLPAALPEIFAVVRLSFSLAVIGVLLGEMFASQYGVGYLLLQSMHAHNVVRLCALTVLITGVALAGNLALLGIERVIVRKYKGI